MTVLLSLMDSNIKEIFNRLEFIAYQDVSMKHWPVHLVFAKLGIIPLDGGEQKIKEENKIDGQRKKNITKIFQNNYTEEQSDYKNLFEHYGLKYEDFKRHIKAK